MAKGKQCKSCNTNITKSSYKLYCSNCINHYHLECTSTSEFDARLLAKTKKPWLCQECETIVNVSSGNGSPDMSSNIICVKKQSSNDKKAATDTLLQKVLELTNEVKELRKDTNSLRASMEYFNKLFEEERSKNQVLTDIVMELKEENVQIKNDIMQLKKVVDLYEQEKVTNNITISGLIDKDFVEKDVDEKVTKLLQKLEPTIKPNDIKVIKIIKTSYNPMVVIQANSPTIKKKILHGKRKYGGKLTFANCGLGTTSRSIYVREELTKWQYELFKAARCLKDVGYKYIWHSNGDILARKTEDSKLVKITDEKMLVTLME